MVFGVSGIVKWQKIEWTIMIYDELLKCIRWATIYFFKACVNLNGKVIDGYKPNW